MVNYYRQLSVLRLFKRKLAGQSEKDDSRTCLDINLFFVTLDYFDLSESFLSTCVYAETQ